MARYDVHVQGGQGQDATLLLDVQADLLDVLNTRIVVPLMRPADAPSPARRLNPVFELSDGPRVMVTQFLSAVPVAILGQPVAHLGEHADDVTAALDMLTHGF